MATLWPDHEFEIGGNIVKKLCIMMLLAAVILCSGCDGDGEVVVENGKRVIDLPPGEKLVNFAASRYQKLVVHRKRQANESPEEYTVDLIDTGDNIHSVYYIIREHQETQVIPTVEREYKNGASFNLALVIL